MKFITTIATARCVTLASMLIGTLASCGGGGSAAVTPVATPAIASFLDIVAAPGFLWSTAQQTKPSIALTRISGAALGNLTLLLSNYVCDGSSPNPVRTSLFTSFSLAPSQQAAVSATVDLAGLKLQVPAAATRVLVEVVDNNRKISLYSKLETPAALATLAIGVQDAPALASCASAG